MTSGVAGARAASLAGASPTNTQSLNIFNGLFRVPVNKKIPALLMTGNKSGPLLLTTFVLTLGAANGWFTFRRAASAVHDGDRPAIGEARRLATGSNFGRAALVACFDWWSQ
jgi:hypothetical protein